MSVFVHSYPVDLQKPRTTKIQTQSLFLTQDNMADRIQAVVTSGGADYAISGGVSAYIMLGNGQTIAVSPAGKSGNVAYVDLPQSAYSVPGVITITLKETVGSTVTSLLQVVGTVKRSATGTIVQPGDPVPSYPEELASICQNAVRVDEEQDFLPTDMAQARANIGAVSATISGTTLVLS